MIGRGKAVFQGNVFEGVEALQLAGLSPLKLKAKDGLGIINSNASTVGIGILVLEEAKRLLDAANISAVLSLEGYAANLDAFKDTVLGARRFKGQNRCGVHLLKLLKGSALWDRERRNIQDPLSFRCIPQVHGACYDALEYAEKQVELMLNSCTDSPLVDIHYGQLFSNGNFEGTSLVLSLDMLILAIHRVLIMSSVRSNKLLWSQFSGLPTALAQEKNGWRGMFLHSALRALNSTITSTHALLLPSNFVNPQQMAEGIDDYSSGTAIAIERLLKLLQKMRFALSIEALFGVYALLIRKEYKLSDFLEKKCESIKKEILNMEISHNENALEKILELIFPENPKFTS